MTFRAIRPSDDDQTTFKAHARAMCLYVWHPLAALFLAAAVLFIPCPARALEVVELDRDNLPFGSIYQWILSPDSRFAVVALNANDQYDLSRVANVYLLPLDGSEKMILLDADVPTTYLDNDVKWSDDSKWLWYRAYDTARRHRIGTLVWIPTLDIIPGVWRPAFAPDDSVYYAPIPGAATIFRLTPDQADSPVQVATLDEAFSLLYVTSQSDHLFALAGKDLYHVDLRTLASEKYGSISGNGSFSLKTTGSSNGVLVSTDRGLDAYLPGAGELMNQIRVSHLLYERANVYPAGNNRDSWTVAGQYSQDSHETQFYSLDLADTPDLRQLATVAQPEFTGFYFLSPDGRYEVFPLNGKLHSVDLWGNGEPIQVDGTGRVTEGNEDNYRYVRFSQDSELIIFLGADGVYAAPIGGGAPRWLEYASDASTARRIFSSMILMPQDYAYVSILPGGQGDYHLFQSSLDGGMPRKQLVSFQCDQQARAGAGHYPESPSVVFLGQRTPDVPYQLFSVSLAPGNPLTELTSSHPSNGNPRPIKVSPDGTHVAYHKGLTFESNRLYRDEQLHLTKVDGTELPVNLCPENTRLSPPAYGGSSPPPSMIIPPNYAFTPDASRLLYSIQQYGRTRTDIYAAPLDGSAPPEALPNPGIPEDSCIVDKYFFLSPNGRFIRRIGFGQSVCIDGSDTFPGELTGIHQWIYDLQGEISPALENIFYSRFTPDGMSVLRSLTLGIALSTYPFDPGQETQIALPHNISDLENCAIDPQTQNIVYKAYINGWYQLFRLPLVAGAVPEQINTDAPAYWAMQYSQDGKKLFYMRSGGPFVLDEQGLGYGFGTCCDEAFNFSATPDARNLIIQTDPATESIDGVDGAKVLVAAPVVFPVDRRNFHTLFNADLGVAVVGEPLITPDSAWVVFMAAQASGIYELYSAPLDASRGAVWLNGPHVDGGGVRAVSLRADGKMVSYAADAEVPGFEQLYSVPVDGAEAPLLRSEPGTETDGPGYWAKQNLVYTPPYDSDDAGAVYSSIVGTVPVFADEPDDASAEAGAPVTVASVIDSDYVLTIQWEFMRAGGPAIFAALSDVPGLTGAHTPTLQIAAMDARWVGVYRCRATNIEGGATSRLVEVNLLTPEGEGAGEGEGEGEGNIEGSPEGSIEGTTEGEGEGVVEGEGTVEGEGAVEGEGSSEGEGAVEGEGEDEGTSEGATEGEGAPEGNEITEGAQALLDNFDQLDTDHDGRISVAEATAAGTTSAATFNAIDTNHDGLLSKEELTNAGAVPPPPAGCWPGRGNSADTLMLAFTILFALALSMNAYRR